MRASGWFFIQARIFDYVPVGAVFGQGAQDSCVAACCRMLLHDSGIETAESYLRAALKLDQGSYLSQVPDVLRDFEAKQEFVYRNDLTLDDLRDVVRSSPAMAFVKRASDRAGHALLVDAISEDQVFLRDPLPLGSGKAYRVSVSDFVQVWLRPRNLLGRAVIAVR